MEKLIKACRTKSTETILECLVAIGGGMVDADHRMVRAALIEVIGEREGDEAMDAVMNQLGM